jgi:hypothetical protein
VVFSPISRNQSGLGMPVEISKTIDTYLFPTVVLIVLNVFLNHDCKNKSIIYENLSFKKVVSNKHLHLSELPLMP